MRTTVSTPHSRTALMFTGTVGAACAALTTLSIFSEMEGGFLCIPPFVASAIGLYVGLTGRRNGKPLRRRVKLAAYFGALASLLSVSAVGIALAVALASAGLFVRDDVVWLLLWICLGIAGCASLSVTCTVACYVERQWFRLRVRTILAAILVLCVLLALLGVQYQEANELRNAISELREQTGTAGVYFDYQVDETFQWRARLSDPPGPEWMELVLGEDFFLGVENVAVVRIDRSAHADDAALAALKQFTNLKALFVYDGGGRRVTDEGLHHLSQIESLTLLKLEGAQITDGGVRNLQGLKSLKRLDLSYSPLTDAAIPHLSELTQLKSLGLHGTQISDKGILELKHALPNTEVSR